MQGGSKLAIALQRMHEPDVSAAAGAHDSNNGSSALSSREALDLCESARGSEGTAGSRVRSAAPSAPHSSDLTQPSSHNVARSEQKQACSTEQQLMPHAHSCRAGPDEAGGSQDQQQQVVQQPYLAAADVMRAANNARLQCALDAIDSAGALHRPAPVQPQLPPQHSLPSGSTHLLPQPRPDAVSAVSWSCDPSLQLPAPPSPVSHPRSSATTAHAAAPAAASAGAGDAPSFGQQATEHASPSGAAQTALGDADSRGCGARGVQQEAMEAILACQPARVLGPRQLRATLHAQERRVSALNRLPQGTSIVLHQGGLGGHRQDEGSGPAAVPSTSANLQGMWDGEGEEEVQQQVWTGPGQPPLTIFKRNRGQQHGPHDRSGDQGCGHQTGRPAPGQHQPDEAATLVAVVAALAAWRGGDAPRAAAHLRLQPGSAPVAVFYAPGDRSGYLMLGPPTHHVGVPYLSESAGPRSRLSARQSTSARLHALMPSSGTSVAAARRRSMMEFLGRTSGTAAAVAIPESTSLPGCGSVPASDAKLAVAQGTDLQPAAQLQQGHSQPRVNREDDGELII